ncbi:MAG: hypothetical protein MJZ76_07480 [Bacteroidales bacterium]|nr:hypothetical protein [Bacteroidales bacterium]
MTSNLLKQFLDEHIYDIRQTHNGRWIDQKCTMDELCFVADCVVNFLDEGGTEPFKSPDIWHAEYSIKNVMDLFGKPDPTDKTTVDEYNKFFRQPLKMLSAAGVLSENKVGSTIEFSVMNRDVLNYLSLNERNCMEFLCAYIEKTLKDSGLWDYFASFFDEQTRKRYKEVKDAFYDFCISNTPINNEKEPGRIFTKVINPLAIKYKKKGTEGGRMSSKIITIDKIKYNQPNSIRDKNKDKNISRQQAKMASSTNSNDVKYNYQVRKVMNRLKKYNDSYNASRSELTDRFSVGAIATHMHHIFPQSSFPEIADYVENLIALTSAQHLQEAHPNGNTQIVDDTFQYLCLINKTESIRKNLMDGFGKPLFYSFENYMTVLDTGFNSTFFVGLEQNDFNSVLAGIEMNYKH